ncbi:Galactoside O-acetyltransferase [Pelagimonas phthalicica]|uniref:Galactoside O-acetyltransferase n=1 Tax=Pelagimonas phthalicica TaxID=1037362 RepID=A0A238JHA0_9RHOB|nr:acetyltransferase [Pelagimonas phthalicica]TDS89242.1 putative colanic acid biosynthesis acetyltransferase WcaF [Pelagimonas phthalicica]SMX29584.1 Galactoside O-acetyltransferase [Pelagimonas phthalicica]
MTPDNKPPVPDVTANRASRKWTRRELAERVLWSVLGHPIFRLSPRPLWGLRNGLLRLFGAKIGQQVRLHPTVKITIPRHLTIADGVGIGDGAILYALGQITIGTNATISQGAHLCAGTHDFRDPTMPLLKLPITIGDGAWICAEAFVGPNVTIGAMSVVGARCVAMKDVPPNAIMAGNPARQVGTR